jgi:uncharacterized membrane protein YdcZ (DUF606 family)
VFEEEVVGFIGLIILVSVFLLHSAGKLRERSEVYFYGFNAIGAFFLTTYAVLLPNILFAVLESIWCVGAVISGAVMLRRAPWNHHGAQ